MRSPRERKERDLFQGHWGRPPIKYTPQGSHRGMSQKSEHWSKGTLAYMNPMKRAFWDTALSLQSLGQLARDAVPGDAGNVVSHCACLNETTLHSIPECSKASIYTSAFSLGSMPGVLRCLATRFLFGSILARTASCPRGSSGQGCLNSFRRPVTCTRSAPHSTRARFSRGQAMREILVAGDTNRLVAELTFAPC